MCSYDSAALSYVSYLWHGHAEYRKHSNSLIASAPEEGCSKTNANVRLPLREQMEKQLLPTGVLELTQPIFAAAWRAFKKGKVLRVFPQFSLGVKDAVRTLQIERLHSPRARRLRRVPV